MKYRVRHEVPFHDVDSLRVVWHGHYYKYFELARSALYRAHGVDIEESEDMGYVFPIIETHCRYAIPLEYGQIIEISASLKACSQYLHIGYEIRQENASRVAARGFTKQAVCRKEDGMMLMEVPQTIVSKLTKNQSAD